MSDEITTGTGSDQGAPPASNNVAELPEWARNKLTAANNEAAGYRIKARDTGAELDTVKGTVQSLTGERDTAKAEAAVHELELMKLRTALSVGVPGEQAADFAELLKGNTPDEIQASAEKAKALIGSGNRRPSATDPSQGRGGSTPTDPANAFHKFVVGQLSRK